MKLITNDSVEEFLMGNITFGPHSMLNSAGEPVEVLQPDRPTWENPWESAKREARSLLLELIDADGVCLGLYWAGRSNRIEKGPRGIEVTYDVAKARRIPLAMRDVAEQLAEALNEYVSIPVEQLGRTWRAVEYARL